MKLNFIKNFDQFLPFGKVWETVPPMAGLSRLAVYVYGFALDASDLQLPKLLQHRGSYQNCTVSICWL